MIAAGPDHDRQYPAELIGRHQWCLWRVEPGKDGCPTKVPYRPDGRKAASNDPRTWSRFGDVEATLARNPELYGGVGYFFSADDTVCGVDLDVSLDAAGAPLPWAVEIVRRFRDTYQSFSVSGLGLHVLCRATLPGRGRNFYVPNGPTDPNGKRAQIGLFDRGRFFALTGRIYDKSPTDLIDHQATIEWLLGSMEPKPAPKPNKAAMPQYMSDPEILERARHARNGSKFVRLWAGDWQSDYGSQSEADLALCCMLAFWCGRDSSRIDGLFRQSGLARDKWLQRDDYRAKTIAAAMAQTTEAYQARNSDGGTPQKPAAVVANVQDAMPEIWVGARQLPAITHDALAALITANDPPQVFSRSGRMVTVVRDEQDRRNLVELTEASLRGRLARSGFYYKLNKNGERVECAPPLDVVRDLLSLPPAEWGLPPLEALTEAPFLRPNGTVCDLPGYDSETSLFYAPAAGLRLPPIPDAPMRDDVDVALDILDSAIGDFPFADAISKANALASMLTPIVRPAIEGPTPLALYDAPQAGTGKTLFAEVLAIVATGRAAETFSAPTDPEEWRKKITTALFTGASVVVIDNVIHRLEADSLCMALTATTIADRMFRTFDRIVLPVRCTWIATGNNIQLAGDMPRRCYCIRLDAKQSQPFRRTGFRHADLRGWVGEHRGELIAALLTIARYWYVQGRPEPKTLKPLGSFESWCRTIGGMLQAAGVEGFLGNADAMFEQSDAEALQWEAFLLALHDVFDGKPFRVSDVVDRLTIRDSQLLSDDNKCLRQALPDFLADAADRTGGFFQRRLGRCFAERLGRRFGDSQVFLERGDEDRKSKVQRWRVLRP